MGDTVDRFNSSAVVLDTGRSKVGDTGHHVIASENHVDDASPLLIHQQIQSGALFGTE
jgi:hypothetical protein